MEAIQDKLRDKAMEKERLIFCIGRYDHYFDSVNNKAAVFLALSTFVVSGLVASYPYLLEKVNCDWVMHSFLIVLIAIGIAILIIVILASTPFASKKGNSLYYFMSISSVEKGIFEAQSKSANEEEELSDLRIQVYNLACGLTAKFRKLKVAGILFIIQLSLFIPLIILLIKNIK